MKQVGEAEQRAHSYSPERNLWLLLVLAVFLFVIAPIVLWWWHQRTDVLPIVWQRSLRQTVVASLPAFLPDGQTIAVLTAEWGRKEHPQFRCFVEFWRLQDGACLRQEQIMAAKEWMNFRLSDSADYAVLYGTQLSVVRLRDKRTLFSHSLPRRTEVEVSPKGRWLIETDGKGNAYWWRLPEGKLVRQQQLRSQIFSLAFSPDERWLAVETLSTPPQVEIWRVADGKQVARLSAGGFVNVAAHSHQSNLLALGREWLVELREVPSGRKVASWRTKGYIWSLAFSPDDAYLAVGTGEGSIEIWRISDRRLVVQKSLIPGWQRFFRSEAVRVAFSRDGQFLVAQLHNNNKFVALRCAFHRLEGGSPNAPK